MATNVWGIHDSDPLGRGPLDQGRLDEAEANDPRKKLAEELGKNEWDPAVEESYYKPRENSINSAFYNASRQAAAGFGKRGLGSSGMAVGNQGDIAFSAAAQKAAAHQSAIDAAKSVRRQGLLDEAGVWSDLYDAEAQKAKLMGQDDANADSRFYGLVGLGIGAGI